MLIALLVLSTLIVVISPMYQTLLQLKQQQNYDYQDQIGIYQLQILLARNNIVDYFSDEIIYQSATNECSVHLTNNRLISTPGFLCYLVDVEEVYFYQSKDILYITYYKNEKDYTYPLAYLAK